MPHPPDELTALLAAQQLQNTLTQWLSLPAARYPLPAALKRT